MKLVDIEGVGEAFAAKLKTAGITSTEALLEKGSTPKGREEIATKSGISGDLILRWVNHCDLFRIKGVGSEYSDLLEKAGVDTVVELSRRNPDSLFEKIVAVNAEKKLVRKLPVKAQVTNWIDQAKKLPRGVSY